MIFIYVEIFGRDLGKILMLNYFFYQEGQSFMTKKGFNKGRWKVPQLTDNNVIIIFYIRILFMLSSNTWVATPTVLFS